MNSLPALPLRLGPPQSYRSRQTTANRGRRSSSCTSSSSSSFYYSAPSSTVPGMDSHTAYAHQRLPTSSPSTASPAVAMPALHLNSFGRLDIADFDPKGRYPTAPSFEHRRGASSYLEQPSAVPPTAAVYVPRREQWEANLISPSTRQSQLNPSHDIPSDVRDTPRRSPVFDSSMQDPPSDYLGRSSVRSRPSTRSNDDEDKQAKSPSLATTPNPIQRPSNDTQQTPVTVGQQQYIPKSTSHNPQQSVGISGPRHPQAPPRPPPTNAQNGQTGVSQPSTYPQQPQVLPPGAAPPNSQQTPVRPAQLFNGPYPAMYSPQQMQNVYRPQNAAAQEEVCIECMMRDRDMADVDVTGPGVWERESDAGLRELIEREDEYERGWYEEHATELAQTGHGLRPPKRRSKGHRLTEQNVKIWLTMNPKEAHARIMTIQTYIKQQGQLLEAEVEARARAREDAQRIDAKVRDTYTQLVRRSVYDLGTQFGSDDGMGGIRIQPPRSSGVWDHSSPKEDLRHRRDVTLLENGMIKERVDVKREEREEERRRRKDEKRVHKASGTEPAFLNSPSQYFASPTATSPYDSPFAEYSHAAALPPQHLSPQQQQQPYPSMSSPSLASLSPRPFSVVMNTVGPMSRAVNQSEVSVGARSTRFFGIRNWANAWGSGTSVAPSGSVMDMHLALDQERRQQQNHQSLSQYDLPSSFSVPNSPRQGRPRTADAGTQPFSVATRSLSPDSAKAKKKKKGLVKLWKKMRGSKDEGRGVPNGYMPAQPQQPRQEDDVTAPLEPPPSLLYLVRFGAGSGGQQRPFSTTSLSGSHPRSVSQPNTGTGSNGAISPTTAPSSTLPSPTWRDSGSDDPKSMIQKDGYDQIPAVQVDGNGQHDTLMVRPSQSPSPTDDPKRMLQVPPSGTPTPTGVLSSITLTTSPIGASSPPLTVTANHTKQRPQSMMIHKSLPPLPPGEFPVPNPARPMASASLLPNFGTPPPDMAMLPNGDQYSIKLGMPGAPFRTQGHDGRRSSFGGVTTRPVVQLDSPPLGAQTMQPQRGYQRTGNGMMFDDVGYLVNGTVPIVKGQRSSPQLRPNTSPSIPKSEKSSKRRSRFGLSALLGKKDKDRDYANSRNGEFSVHSQTLSADYDYRTLKNPSSDGTGYTNGLTAPNWRFGHPKRAGSSSSLVIVEPEMVIGGPPSMVLSSPSGENAPRSLNAAGRQPSHASSTTGKRVEELVARDDDFVAYRYPSTDQQLDLPRR